MQPKIFLLIKLKSYFLIKIKAKNIYWGLKHQRIEG